MRYREASIWLFYDNRIGWLVTLVFVNLASSVVSALEQTLSSVITLAFFIPLLIDSSGNAGSRLATLMVRALAAGEVKVDQWIRTVLKELGVGAALGLTMPWDLPVCCSVLSAAVPPLGWWFWLIHGYHHNNCCQYCGHPIPADQVPVGPRRGEQPANYFSCLRRSPVYLLLPCEWCRAPGKYELEDLVEKLFERSGLATQARNQWDGQGLDVDRVMVLDLPVPDVLKGMGIASQVTLNIQVKQKTGIDDTDFKGLDQLPPRSFRQGRIMCWFPRRTTSPRSARGRRKNLA